MTDFTTPPGAQEELEILLPEGRTAFGPGERIGVEARWWVPEPAKRIELRLVWYTSGRGDQDVNVVTVEPLLEAPEGGVGQQGSRVVSLELPREPYSVSGKLITLSWAVELVVDDGHASTRTDIVIAPESREITLTEVEGSEDRAAFRLGS